MWKPVIILFSVFLISCKSTSYFVVRHAERADATMGSDVPLSAAGQQRAEALREVLKNEGILHIYSTNYVRTRSTAQPLANAIGLPVNTYQPNDTSFIRRVKAIEKGNVLIVGHSNTVDDLVNQLMGERVINGDLPDSQYGDLYVVKKKGKKVKFEQRRF